ncbi:type II and III secretion system protein family protein [Herminiimonas contaminans]|uniref:Type II and III secretion system protein family protein n=1 Tax=Herminiimonas contaminans TaxID=1111140 RepID=A0ABS0EWZ8_9BURK|nr:type II and III secretion system protein family protein [Herminiimonas contaminans]MBF8178352.1 type II and III secretion system protein family protein [Herminiimonas contaminans]
MRILNALVIVAGLLSSSVLAEDMNVTVRVREQLQLKTPADLERIAVADPEVADVLIIKGSGKRPGSIMLLGKKPGSTSVTAWQRNGPTKVWQVQVQSALQSTLPEEGMDLQISGDTASLRGQAPSLLSHANVATAGAQVVGREKLLDSSTVATSGMVQIDVQIVEFSRNVLKEAGFDFLFNQNRGATFSFGLNNFSTILSSTVQTPVSQAFNLLGSSSVNARVKLIEQNGLARVLARPSLTALSGQSASFLAGGELPVPQSGGLGTTTVIYKSFGIGLTVTPTVLSANRIALKVAPEASDLDYANAIVTNNMLIPAISTRRTETTLELGDGESFVIGGLVSRTTKSSVNKVPFLGDLPILGPFFRSMQYSQDEKELVIIATPHLVKPIAKGTQLPLPGDDKERRDTPANAWGSYVMGVAGRDDLPGFSK